MDVPDQLLRGGVALGRLCQGWSAASERREQHHGEMPKSIHDCLVSLCGRVRIVATAIDARRGRDAVSEVRLECHEVALASHERAWSRDLLQVAQPEGRDRATLIPTGTVDVCDREVVAGQ